MELRPVAVAVALVHPMSLVAVVLVLAANVVYGHGDNMINNYAIIENGKVVNIALSEKPLGDNWVKSNKARIGDEYKNKKFVKPAKTVNENPVKKDKIDLVIDALIAKGVINQDDIK